MSVLNVLYKNVCPQSRLSSKSPVLNVACPQCRLSSTSLLSFQRPTIKYHLVLNVSEWCFIACEKTAAEQKAPLVILTIPRLLTLISSYLFSSSNTLAFLPENSRKCLRKVLATRCDPSQRHAWEKWRTEKEMGPMKAGVCYRVLQPVALQDHMASPRIL